MRIGLIKLIRLNAEKVNSVAGTSSKLLRATILRIGETDFHYKSWALIYHNSSRCFCVSGFRIFSINVCVEFVRLLLSTPVGKRL